MNHKLVPTLLTEPMSEVIRNEHCVYQTEQELYNALLEAAPDVPVGLEPVAYMAPTGTCVKAGYVSYTPNWTDYYTTPLVRQSAAAAVIAAKDAEIEMWKHEAQRLNRAGAELTEQLAVAEKQRDELLALLLRAEDAIEALDGTSVENEKLVDDYRALIEKVKGAA